MGPHNHFAPVSTNLLDSGVIHVRQINRFSVSMLVSLYAVSLIRVDLHPLYRVCSE